MGTKLGAVLERPVSKGICKHHWLIEPPNGPTSNGVCKLCGEVKMFDNILSDLLSNNDNAVFSATASPPDKGEGEAEEDDTL